MGISDRDQLIGFIRRAARTGASVDARQALLILDEVESLRAAGERVRELHVQGMRSSGCIMCDPQQFGMPYPCPTRRALDDEA